MDATWNMVVHSVRTCNRYDVKEGLNERKREREREGEGGERSVYTFGGIVCVHIEGIMQQFPLNGSV